MRQRKLFLQKINPLAIDPTCHVRPQLRMCWIVPSPAPPSALAPPPPESRDLGGWRQQGSSGVRQVTQVPWQ